MGRARERKRDCVSEKRVTSMKCSHFDHFNFQFPIWISWLLSQLNTSQLILNASHLIYGGYNTQQTHLCARISSQNLCCSNAYANFSEVFFSAFHLSMLLARFLHVITAFTVVSVAREAITSIFFFKSMKRKPNVSTSSIGKCIDDVLRLDWRTRWNQQSCDLVDDDGSGDATRIYLLQFLPDTLDFERLPWDSQSPAH